MDGILILDVVKLRALFHLESLWVSVLCGGVPLILLQPNFCRSGMPTSSQYEINHSAVC